MPLRKRHGIYILKKEEEKSLRLQTEDLNMI